MKKPFSISRLRTHPHDARDLSEPLNGTTSGCPPPSLHHNYRRTLHTQQRNRFGGCSTIRFWEGVAQITRRRDRTFFVSLCYITNFYISSICNEDRCAGNGWTGFHPPHVESERIEPSKRPFCPRDLAEIGERSHNPRREYRSPWRRWYNSIIARSSAPTAWIGAGWSDPGSEPSQRDTRPNETEFQKPLFFGHKILF